MGTGTDCSATVLVRALKGNTKGVELFKSDPDAGRLRVWMGLHSTALPGYSGQES